MFITSVLITIFRFFFSLFIIKKNLPINAINKAFKNDNNLENYLGLLKEIKHNIKSTV